MHWLFFFSPHNGPTTTWLLGAIPVHVLEQPSSTQGRPSSNPSKLCRSADECPLLALSAMHCKSFCFANCHTPQGCSENFAYQVNLLQILGYVVAFPVPAAISTATMLRRSTSCHRSCLDLLRRLNMQLLCCGAYARGGELIRDVLRNCTSWLRSIRILSRRKKGSCLTAEKKCHAYLSFTATVLTPA